MDEYKVVITHTALSDLDEIVNYISNQLLNPEAALKLYDELCEAIYSLEHNPYRRMVIGSLDSNTNELRQLMVNHYSVIFSINKNKVYVQNVVYSSSDLNTKLS